MELAWLARIAGRYLLPVWLLIGSLIVLPQLVAFAQTIGFGIPIGARVGGDHIQYMEAARSWLGGGEFYHGWQLVGPYPLDQVPTFREQPVLYPPYALVLFVPFAMLPGWLAAPLWWGIPLGIVAWSLRHAPLWAWPVIAACLTWPQSLWLLISGNPAALWGTASVALGLRYGWPALGVLIRPTMAPFALIGIRHRRWWLALLAGVLVSLAFLPMWPDYVRATLNLRGVTSLYVFEHLPLAMMPVIAWLAHRRAPSPASRLDVGRGGRLRGVT